jgi:hypothetical protein
VFDAVVVLSEAVVVVFVAMVTKSVSSVFWKKHEKRY